MPTIIFEVRDKIGAGGEDEGAGYVVFFELFGAEIGIFEDFEPILHVIFAVMFPGGHAAVNIEFFFGELPDKIATVVVFVEEAAGARMFFEVVYRGYGLVCGMVERGGHDEIEGVGGDRDEKNGAGGQNAAEREVLLGGF